MVDVNSIRGKRLSALPTKKAHLYYLEKPGYTLRVKLGTVYRSHVKCANSGFVSATDPCQFALCAKDPLEIYDGKLWLEKRDDSRALQLFISHELSLMQKLNDEFARRNEIANALIEQHRVLSKI